jgi:peptidoglycan/xylan/chitin deacetylase (PgdA/CDA1 family)
MMPGCVVLMYHVIDSPRAASEARFCTPQHVFRQQMRHLYTTGWNVIPLAELVRSVTEKRPAPARSVVITFDDGTACTHEAALPVLSEFGFSATVFAVSDLVGGRNEWMIREGQPARPMLSTLQLRELHAAGVEIGSHTARHAWMDRISPSHAADEARMSKARLEEILGHPVRHFAYPYGNHSQAVRDVVRDAGYEAACTTRSGKNGPDTEIFALRRTEIRGDDSMWQFCAKLLSGTHDMPPWSLARATARRMIGATRAS